MMDKETKKNYVEEMKKSFTANESVMIAQYQGLNVNELDVPTPRSHSHINPFHVIVHPQVLLSTRVLVWFRA